MVVNVASNARGGKPGKTPRINLDVLPPELGEINRWVLWKWHTRDGKRTKPPFDPKTGQPGDATDPALHMSLGQAMAELARFDGLGFAIGGTGFTGVDLDNCIDEEGRIAPWAQAIVDELNSYTEITPSGKGLRVWVRGKLPPGRRRKGNVEMYDEGRYFTVTARHLDGTPTAIANREKELHALHARIFPPARPAAKRVPSASLSLTDQEILGKMFRAKNGRDIEALFDGDVGKHPSMSEAQLALCSHFAYWTGGDAAAIDRLMRQSGLCNGKWLDRDDYRERTIAKALEIDQVYNPKRNGHANGNGKPKLAVVPEVPVPPREPGEDEDENETVNRTDLGNALRLVAKFGDEIRYCPAICAWFVWDGTRWKEDATGRIYRLAKKTVQSIAAEAANIGDDDDRKAMLRWAIESESRKRIEAMIALARFLEGVPIEPGDLNSNPWLLNCRNGTVDLRTGRRLEHDPRHLITKICPVDYDPTAKCPQWERFEASVFVGQQEDGSYCTDHELIAYVRRAFGHALTGDNSVQELNILHGDGSNGKNVLIDSLRRRLGDYGTKAESSLLMAKKYEDHPTGVADLDGKRFVAASETGDGKRLAESLVKSLTGDDTIKARRMRSDFYEFKRTFKIFLATNHRPTIKGTDFGIWRRIRLIPFHVKFVGPEEEECPPLKVRKVDGLTDILDAEAPGILATFVRGCLDWQKGGMRPPKAVIAATDEYRKEMDTLGDFIAEECVIASQCSAGASELHQAYTRWCEDNRVSDREVLGSRAFAQEMERRGFRVEHTKRGNRRNGVGLRDKKATEADGRSGERCDDGEG